MYRGTTPTLRFELEDESGQKIPASLIKELYITFVQDQIMRLERTDAVMADNIASVKLTQQETLALSSGIDKYPVEIQLRGTMVDGNVFASNIIIASVAKILKDGVI